MENAEHMKQIWNKKTYFWNKNTTETATLWTRRYRWKQIWDKNM